jgi:membrane dipeptidase
MKTKILALLIFPILSFAQQKIDSVLYKKSIEILSNTISVDSHSDTPLKLKDSTFKLNIRNSRGCFDFIRMKEGKLSAEFFAAFVGNNDDLNHPFKIASDILNDVFKAMELNKNIAAIAQSPEDIEKNLKNGLLSVCLGMENGGPLEGKMENLKIFSDLGVRYITLTHSRNNDICDSSTDTLELWHGLSTFGKELVKKMNEYGIMIDVSHISDKSFWDAIKLSKAPIIASHSCCRAICSSPRNLSDEMIIALAKNGGVIQMNFYPGYIDEEYNVKSSKITYNLRPQIDSLKKVYGKRDTEYYAEYIKLRKKYNFPEIPGVEKLVDHIDHIVKLVGVDYVGIGSDFDGLSVFPKGLEDVSKLPVITYHLLKRGYSEKDIKKIVGGNFLRVWKKVQELAVSN